jgi:hypothetical protein
MGAGNPLALFFAVVSIVNGRAPFHAASALFRMAFGWDE